MTSLPQPPNTAVKKARARLVFGCAAFGDDDVDSSLTYSPSPEAPSIYLTKATSQVTTSITTTQPEQQQENAVSPAARQTTTAMPAPSPACSVVSNSSCSTSSSTSTNSTVTAPLGQSRRQDESQCVSPSSFDSSCTRRTLSAGPFDKIIADDAEKENTSSSALAESVLVESNKKKTVAKDPANGVTSKSPPLESKPFSPGKSRKIQRPFTARSPLRPDFVKKTQDAINKAVVSVNHSLAAAKMSKQASFRKKVQETAKVRQEWKEDTVQAQEFNQQAEGTRREFLNLKREVSSKVVKDKSKRELDLRQQRLEEIDKEAKFKSSVYREQQERLREEEKRRQRMSIEAREKLRQNHKEGRQRLKMQRIEEEQAIIEERHEASIALQTTREQQSKQRRDSFAFRRGDAMRIRRLHRDLEANQHRAEHESYELKWDGDRDAENYRRKLEEARRESLAGRNQAARMQRQRHEEELARQKQAEHESYELKREAEKDAEAYKRLLEEQRRNSLAGRNAYAHKVRTMESEQHAKDQEQQHTDFELKWAAEKDAAAYQKQLEAERRESLAERNRERLRHANVMAELQKLAQEKETESLVLKWAAEDDAKAYLKSLEEKRRQSLQQRGKHVMHGRQIEEKTRQEELNRMMEDEVLKAGDQKDVEAYRKECQNRDRASLQYRGKEICMRRVQDEEKRAQEQGVAENNFALETLARNDVELYIEDCKQRRRMSLALRAKEKRRHARWRQAQARSEVDERSRQVRDRLLDRRYEELARQQQRARLAMDAIRHTGCTFNSLGLQMP